MEGSIVSYSRNFWPFFFSHWDRCVRFFIFFFLLFPFTLGGFFFLLLAVFYFSSSSFIGFGFWGFFFFLFFHWVLFLIGFFSSSLGFWVQFFLLLVFVLSLGSFFGWIFLGSVFFFFFTGFGEFGYRKKKKKKRTCTTWQVWGSQIVWKILSDEKWVMVPNGCKKLSDEWWKLSDGNWMMKFLHPNSL